MAQASRGRVHRRGGKFYQGLTEKLLDFVWAEFREQNDDEAAPPEQLGYLWQWFCDLSDWRDSSMGVGSLSHQEIESWARLYQVDISPFEVDVLRKIDREYRLSRSEEPVTETPIGEQIRAAVKTDGR